MKCNHCKRPVVAGSEAQKMIVEYKQVDGSTKVFGYLMPDGPLHAATGRIQRGWHHKCFHVIRKRQARGDEVTGRVLTGAVPTGYEIGALIHNRDEFEALGVTEQKARERGTAYLTDRLNRLRQTAHRIGKAVGDPGVQEAYRAEEHGGPYPHTHDLALTTYHLRQHLSYAHGYDPEQRLTAGERNTLHQLHDELHARDALTATRSTRLGDPGHVEPKETDWREQVVVEIDEIHRTTGE